jgi:hypothetical protein
MATISKNTGYNLNLNTAEAVALCKILTKVGGNPLGPRGDLDKIYHALLEQSEHFDRPRDNIMVYNPDDVHGHAALYIDRIEDVPTE